MFITWHQQEQNIYIEWIYIVRMSWGRIKLCAVITESIGKMDQEVLFWAHFCMDSFIILCKKKKSQIAIYYKMGLLLHLNKEVKFDM